MIGAHPDDEYSDLVALFARGMGAQVAYLSLSRGRGRTGTSIGPELGPELGIIRSEELLAPGGSTALVNSSARLRLRIFQDARRGAALLARDSVLRDVLDVIRRFRPQVIVSVFSGTPRDGHGQQSGGRPGRAPGVRALRDSSWGPVKLYRSLYFDTASATLRLDAECSSPCRVDPTTRSPWRPEPAPLAGEGQLEQPGPRIARLVFVEWRDAGRGTKDGDGLFAGVDTVFPGKPRYAWFIDRRARQLTPRDPTRSFRCSGAPARARRRDSAQQSMLQEACRRRGPW